ncbi:MAG: WbuC family cupin fold metalloprotein [Tannerella sp.]|nr:WbuC family cupin fold metalloprotein [Tannerella sp.]
MKVIDRELLDETSARAKMSPRLRMNCNFHARADDPVNRLLNAMEPGTYLRPHCHPDKEEIFLLLRGRVAILIFDDGGRVTEKVLLDPLQGCFGGEIPTGVWHGLLVLAPESVVYEVKRGPYVPLSTENMAPWAPPAEDAGAVSRYMDGLYGQIESWRV